MRLDRSNLLAVGIVCLWATLLPAHLLAQGFPNLRAWGEPQGIDLAFVTAAAQTTDGYLWFGSPAGLFRFNGHEFVALNPRAPNANADDYITALLADARGGLWVGTQREGLHRYLDGRFTPFRAESGISNDRIQCLAQDSSGRIWVGTDGGGAFYGDGAGFLPLSLTNEPTITHPTAMSVDSTGRLFIGTFKGQLLAVSQLQPTWILRRGPSIRALQVDADDRLWLGTSSGLARMENGRPQRVPLLQPDGTYRTNAFITAIREDRFGNLWVGNFTGLVNIRSGVQSHLGTADGLGNGLVTSLFADRAGSLWVGTEIGDLYQLTRRKIRMRSPFPTGLPSVSAMALADDGTLWLGGPEGTTILRTNSPGFTLPPLASQPIADVTCIGLDPQGRTWLGNRFGEWGHLLDGTFTPVPTKSLERGGRSPNFFLSTRQHGFLMGTEGGLYRLGAGDSLMEWTDPQLSHRDVTCAVEGPDGLLWIGTGNGLNRYHHGSTETFIDLPPRPLEQVADLALDADTTLWVSTARGLWRVRNGRFFAFGPEHDAPPTAGPIVDDLAGHLWVGLGGKIARFAKTNLHAVADGQSPRLTYRTWSGVDGLKSIVLATGRCGVGTPDGTIHFATDKGVATVDPSEVPTLDVPPVPTLERVFVDGRPATDWTPANSGDSPQTQRPPLDLEPGYHRIEIHYTALNTVDPHRVQYQHRLLGLNDAWEEARNERIAFFRALPAGDYTFELTAANATGRSAENSAMLRIRVAATWWQTTAFKAALAAFAAVVVGAGYSLRVRRLKWMGTTQREFSRRLLEHEENERRRLAKELHDGLGQDLLILRNHVALLGLQWPDAPPGAAHRLREIDAASQTAIDQTRAIAHNLRPAELERVGLTSALEDMIRRASDSSSIRFAGDFEAIDGLVSKEEEVLLYRVAQELVNNILKHSGATQAHLSVHVVPGDSVHLIVTDDGKGFDPETIRQTSGSRRGLGLDSVAERVAMLSGTFDFESRPGSGSRSHIRIPLRRNPPQ
jgi:signal transduction histidine kinase/ligand-binding sensor domain-containing protein